MKLSQLISKIRIKSEYGAKTPWHKLEQWQKESRGFRVTLRYKRRQMTLDFFQGASFQNDPLVSYVVSCLITDAFFADMSFESFCGELGYDTDSRKALKTYDATVKQTKRFCQFLGDDFDAFMSAKNDL